MRQLALLFLSVLALAGCGLVRAEADAAVDAGPLTASLVDLNGGLSLPGVDVRISPDVVATSEKFYLRKDKASPPNCYYGVFASDPRFLPGGDGGAQPNNGLLLVSLGDMNAINANGGPSRTSCPGPASFQSGGGVPDVIAAGDALLVEGELTPYCDHFDTRAGQCGTPVFPEFTVKDVQDLTHATDGGQQSVLATTVAPMIVQPADIEDGAASAASYAGMLLEVDEVVVTNAHPDIYSAVIVSPQHPAAGSAPVELWVDSFDSRAAVVQVVGTKYSKIRGVLHYGYGHWRLVPRLQSDLIQ